jgi:hypothetical protein
MFEKSITNYGIVILSTVLAAQVKTALPHFCEIRGIGADAGIDESIRPGARELHFAKNGISEGHVSRFPEGWMPSPLRAMRYLP